MINYIAKITIYVNNQEEAKQFWTERWDLFVMNNQWGPNFKWMEVKPNESTSTSFVIYEKQLMKAQNPNMSVEHPNVILSTSSIETVYNKLKENEVEVGPLQEMPYGKMFSFKDQDGNNYLLREDK